MSESADRIAQLEARVALLESALNNLTVGPTRGQCGAVTKKGEQCKRTAKGQTGMCWQHQGQIRTSRQTRPRSEPGSRENPMTIYSEDEVD